MWDMIVPSGAGWLPALALAALATAITSIVAAYRKLKSGEIEDDEALLTRAMNAAKSSDEARQAAELARDRAVAMFEEKRRELWRAEDLAALYLRQLIEHGISPVTIQTDERTDESNA